MQDKQNKRGAFAQTARFIMALLLACVTHYAAPAYSAPKPMLVLGDSLSAEYGLPRGSGWVSLLGNRLRSEKFDVHLINASISGETTAGGKARLPTLLQQHKPAIVILELGGNDGLRGLALAATQANLREMIKLANTAGAQVLLVGMQVPPNYGPDYSKRFIALFQTLGKERGVRLVPFLLTGLDDMGKFFQPDRIHPNKEAQPIMLDNVWPGLKTLLKENRKSGQ